MTFVFGQTYTGKTTLMRRELEKRAGLRALIFDPSCSQALDGLAELTTRAGCKRFLTGPDSAGTWIRTVRLPDPDDYGWLASTSRVWRGVTWILDDGRTLMEVKAVERAAGHCAIAGRHYGDNREGVELWFVGHRPSDANASIRSAVGAVYSFRQVEPRDIELLTGWCGREFAQKVARLGDHEWVKWPPERKRLGAGGSRPVVRTKKNPARKKRRKRT